MSTIFAPLTLKGLCSVYVIRISGNESLKCLNALGVKKLLTPQRATLCKLKDKDNQILDEALVIYFKAPHSFTGEDVVEINLHCSNYIISKAFSILSSVENVRMAERGEFSKRAFLNNKIDLMQAESIVDLINAETEMQHKLAINQLQGKNSNFYNNLRQKIVEILALLEAFIDFPEEDIPQDIQDEILAKISNIKAEIQQNLNDNNVGEKIRDGFHISIIGEPNAGKSTLIKLILKEEEPTSGRIIINGKDTTFLKPNRVPYLRRSMGVVFQDFRLLQDKTVYDNVAYAMYIVRATPRHIRRQVPMVLSLVGLSGKAKMYPNELSGGEQQRVALARALVNNPSMLIADEPTGNLDPDTAWDIMNLLNDINMRGTTVVVATHAKDIVDKMKKRVIHIRKGEIIRDDKKGGYDCEI